MSARKLEKYLARQLEQRVLQDSVEREQKYRVRAIDPLRRRLLSLGAEIHASGFERNELFDFDGRLRKQGHKLRLRRHGSKLAMLTLKGPRLAGRQKTRMEVETPVQYEPTKRILELVGFRIKETYSKIREEYRLDGCAVALDHIPSAGWFVEIEGTPGRIRDIARRLGLQSADREHRSYRKLIKETSAASQSHANHSERAVPRMKLLIVDDEFDLCRLLAEHFEEHFDADVFTATTPDDALQLLKELQPEGMLLDINLRSRLTGFDVLARLNEVSPTTKVIMLTSVNDFASVEKALELGAVDYITKPFTVEYLEQTVDLKVKRLLAFA